MMRVGVSDRGVFLAAGLYNPMGLYAVIDPQWLFRFARMPHENYPQIFAPRHGSWGCTASCILGGAVYRKRPG